MDGLHLHRLRTDEDEALIRDRAARNARVDAKSINRTAIVDAAIMKATRDGRYVFDAPMPNKKRDIERQAAVYYEERPLEQWMALHDYEVWERLRSRLIASGAAK